MRYKVNTSCTECGRRYSYWSDDAPELKHCPNDPPAPTERELVAAPIPLRRVPPHCRVCHASYGAPHNRSVHDEYDNARMGIG